MASRGGGWRGVLVCGADGGASGSSGEGSVPGGVLVILVFFFGGGEGGGVGVGGRGKDEK